MENQEKVQQLLDLARLMRELESKMAACPVNGIDRQSWNETRNRISSMAALVDATRIITLLMPREEVAK